MGKIEEVESIAKCLGVTPEEIRFMIKHYEMPITDPEFGEWGLSHMPLFIQLVSGLFYEQARLEFAEIVVE